MNKNSAMNTTVTVSTFDELKAAFDWKNVNHETIHSFMKNALVPHDKVYESLKELIKTDCHFMTFKKAFIAAYKPKKASWTAAFSDLD